MNYNAAAATTTIPPVGSSFFIGALVLAAARGLFLAGKLIACAIAHCILMQCYDNIAAFLVAHCLHLGRRAGERK